ncbi:MAG: omptin family outer membrane protease, partial [Candidatus Latescibacterota bacterium]
MALVLSLVVAGTPAFASSAEPVEGSRSTNELGLRFTATVSSLFGETAYELNAKSEDPANPGTLVDIRSRLEFPLDVTLLGVAAGWEPGQASARRWSVAAGVHTNVSDPSDKMTDEDWVGSKQLGYTESNADLELIFVTADVGYRFRKGDRSDLSLLFHFDYQRIEQHLVGFEGWRGSLFSDQRFPVSGTAPVIDYEVSYVSPQVGAAGTYLVGAHARLGAQASIGAVYASDTDDHLLRGRISEGEGWGVALNTRVVVDLLPGFLPLNGLTMGLVGELRFFHAEGEVDQRWYR